MGKNVEEVDFDRLAHPEVEAWDIFKRKGIFELRGADGFIGYYDKVVFGWNTSYYNDYDTSFYLTIGYMDDDDSDMLDYFDLPDSFFKEAFPTDRITHQYDDITTLHEFFCPDGETLAQTMARVANVLVSKGFVWNPYYAYEPE